MDENTTNESVQEEYQVDHEALEKLSKEYTDLVEKLSQKLYIVDGGEEIANFILEWLENDVEWQFSECSMVTGIHREVKQALSKIDKKHKHLELKGSTLKGMQIFFQKTSGKGLKSADKFEKLALAILHTLNNSVDNDVKELEKIVEKRKELLTGLKTESR